ncbi:phosphopantetheine-binding protein [Kitasatospora purpeofusca]|uniref:phosphopantetheine-binding protein n=1 Tax=Kitasatospora purpeofusca TaxID=67352 RepID=UPI0004C14B18|nr:phosphopantetheine-binding protein [Kitasatospora purpeofusca]
MDFAVVIAEIWCEVLEVPEVGDEDNFFDLGGHSVLLRMVQERVVRRTGREVELVEFFTHPTVRSLARHLRDGGTAAPAGAGRRATGRLNRLGNRRAQLGGTPSDTHGDLGE